MTWTEGDLLGEYAPSLNIKKYSAKKIAELRSNLLANSLIRENYLKEYKNSTGIQEYLNASVNYFILKGTQTNLYKCFLPISWMCGNNQSVISFIHPDGVYDDPKGTKLRKKIYSKLKSMPFS